MFNQLRKRDDHIPPELFSNFCPNNYLKFFKYECLFFLFKYNDKIIIIIMSN